MTLRAHTHRCYGLKAMTGKNLEQRAFEERLRLKIEAYHEAALVYAAVKLDLPDRMGERTWTAEQLAGALGTSAPHLFRFLRGLTTLGICRELPDGTFALAPGGWSLRSNSHSRLNKKVQIVVEQYWRPWADLVSCLKTGKPAFDHVFGMSVGEWRERNPAQGLMFESYLTDETFAQAGSILEVLECAAEAKKVADIGGGCGALLTPLLIAFPHLTGVLFETPHMIEMAKPFLRVFDQFHLLDRIELVPGDFFEGVPVKADLYLLKNVLQQWDDARRRRHPAQCPQRHAGRRAACDHRAADAGARRRRPSRHHGRSAYDDHHRRAHPQRDGIHGSVAGSRADAGEDNANDLGPRRSSRPCPPSQRRRRRAVAFNGHFPGPSITTKFAPLRVSAVAGASVVTSTVPGFMRLRMASITSGEPSMRSSTAVFGAVASSSPAWKPMPSQLEPLGSPPCHTNTFEPIALPGSLMLASPSATIAPFCRT